MWIGESLQRTSSDKDQCLEPSPLSPEHSNNSLMHRPTKQQASVKGVILNWPFASWRDTGTVVQKPTPHMKEITKLICRSLGQKCWLLHTSTCAFHFQQPRTSHIYICMFVDYTSMIPRECPIPIQYAWLRLKLGYPKIPYVTYKTSWAESLMQVLAIRCTKGSLKTLPTWTMGHRQASCYIRQKQWTSKYGCVCMYVCI